MPEMRLTKRDGREPVVHPSAKVAASAELIGAVSIGARCYIDHHVVIESAGPPIEVGDESIILAGTVIRSAGGRSRPSFDVRVGPRSLIAPHCTLVGAWVGRNCYIATGVIVLQGARIADDCLIGVGAIVHALTRLPAGTRVGLRHVAVPEGDEFLSTADIDLARKTLGSEQFFEAAFGVNEGDQVTLHEQVLTRLLDEVHGWNDVGPRIVP
jgi:carbonic anhydrase/acetyltransferase-like protein (isoleucine patch superfamily)